MVGDALEHVAQVSLRIEADELGRADQGVNQRRAVPAVVGAKMQVIFSADRNRRVILPMSGKKLKSSIAGIPSTGVASGGNTASSAPTARSFT